MKRHECRAWTGFKMQYPDWNLHDSSNRCLSAFLNSIRGDAPIMSWIGFMDFDSNLIYESDVIEYKFNYAGGVYHEGIMVIKSVFDHQSLAAVKDASHIKIVGNIFENPEYLKKICR